jgi:hypothetical protein
MARQARTTQVRSASYHGIATLNTSLSQGARSSERPLKRNSGALIPRVAT